MTQCRKRSLLLIFTFFSLVNRNYLRFCGKLMFYLIYKICKNLSVVIFCNTLFELTFGHEEILIHIYLDFQSKKCGLLSRLRNLTHTQTWIFILFNLSVQRCKSRWKNTDFLNTSYYNNASQKYKRSNTCEISHAWTNLTTLDHESFDFE